MQNPRLLLTGLDMLDTRGVERVAAVRPRKPELPVLTISGRAEDEASALSPHFLPRPSSLDSLDGVFARAWTRAAVHRIVAH